MNCHRRKKFENKDKEKDHGAGLREKEWGGAGGGGRVGLNGKAHLRR